MERSPFKVTSVIKGQVDSDVVSVGYESGKRDAQNPKVRLSYQYEGLNVFQREDGSLRSAAELAGQTFVVFAKPNTGSVPRDVASHVQALWSGIAQLHGSALVFGDGTRSPVRHEGAYVVIHLEELVAAAT
jgi:hypothetical protein